ncbi:MAG: hypothetical protein ABI548_10980 [Polyangiaceae bacterium]
MKFSVICLGLAVGLGACSAKDQPADPYATVAGLCEAWGKAACNSTVVTNCAGVDKVTDELTQGCIVSQASFCEGLVPVSGYSSEQASVCLDAVRSAYADGKLSAEDVSIVRHRGEPCNHLIKGPQDKDGDCTTDDDCDTLKNYVCVLKGAAGSCEIPTVVDNGDSCKALDAACKDGHYCDSGLHCVQSSDVGASCTDTYECLSGLDCDADTQQCAERVSPAKCTADSDCTSGVCDIASGSKTGKCVTQVTLTQTDSLCEDLAK